MASDMAAIDTSNDTSHATCLSDLAQKQDYNRSWQFFAYGSHTSGNKPSQDNGAASSTSTSNGFTVGANNQISEDWNIGAVLGYDDGTTSSADGAGTTTAKSYSANLYAGYTIDSARHWLVSGDLGFAATSYDGTRSNADLNNGTATSSTTGTTINAAIQTGYKFDVWNGAQVMPLAGLTYTNSSVGATTESLPSAQGLALAYDKSTTSTCETVVGAELAQRFTVQDGFFITPSARLAWHHQLNNNQDSAVSTHFVGDPTNSFNTYLQTANSDAVSIEVGVAAQFEKNWKVFANLRDYKELGSGGSNEVGVGAGVQYSF